jgi:hypothetical protein
MLPARFLGISEDSGDAFTFYVLPEGKTPSGRPWKVLTRRIVKPRAELHTDVSSQNTTSSKHNRPSSIDIDDDEVFEEIVRPKIGGRRSRGAYVDPNRRPKRRRLSEAVIDSTAPQDEHTTSEESIAEKLSLEFDAAPHTVKAPSVAVATLDPATPAEEPNPGVSDATIPETEDDCSLGPDDTNTSAGSPIKIVTNGDSADYLPSNIDPQAVNDFFDQPRLYPGQLVFDSILRHRHVNGNLDLRVLYQDRSQSWVPFSLLSHDEPLVLARYLLSTTIEQDRNGRYSRWARQTIRDVNRTIRRLHQHHDMDIACLFPAEASSSTASARRTTTKKPGQCDEDATIAIRVF